MRDQNTAIFRIALVKAIIFCVFFSLVSSTYCSADSGIITYKGGAVYEGELERFSQEIQHTEAELEPFEGGRIVERGTHAELLAHNGAYARLYHEQFEATAPGLS